ncbi:hypothetical protein LCGC14_0215210 [marine sediment metagenome]|uniref:Uncharacterized protein n=1 Tax=marine sediment metagenome TaxID=412755 RepID=A0A0F9UIZ4_9ZZZZ
MLIRFYEKLRAGDVIGFSLLSFGRIVGLAMSDSIRLNRDLRFFTCGATNAR